MREARGQKHRLFLLSCLRDSLLHSCREVVITAKAQILKEATDIAGGDGVVTTPIVDGTPTVVRMVVYQSAVADSHHISRPVIDAATIAGGGRVIGDEAPDDGHHATKLVVDAAAIVAGCVVGDEALAYVQRATVEDAATAKGTVDGGCVVGDKAPGNGHRATGTTEDATA